MNKGNTKKYSYESLLKMELHHVVLDEPYSLLCIMNVLINNLMRERVEWDKKKNLNKKRAH